MYELTVELSFSSAHNLREYDGNCERLHGHNWRVEVSVASDELDRLGMVMDFRTLKSVAGEVIDGLDHRYLNETPPFDAENPTAEHIAAFIFRQVAQRLSSVAGAAGRSIRVSRVKVWESGKSAASYCEEQRDAGR